MESFNLPTLAVFGGSFDPLHNGHLYMAGEILRQKYAQEVLFVPAAAPPHKADRAVTPANQRLEMLAKAVERYEGFSYSDIELQRDNYSYTINTLQILSNLYTEYTLKFVMGMDSLQDIHKWHRAPEMVNHYSFIIIPRPDTPPPSRGSLAEHFGQVNATKLLASIVDVQSVAIASKQVRRCYQDGSSVAGLIPESVQEYIRTHQLYA